MYTLIFIDDENIIRDGVENCINWEQNGFILRGTFANGQDALAVIENEHIDVVISDINMPRMDGLVLSKILNETYPEIITILLTGYDQFEYAQQAIKYKVTDFILKPITASELTKVLTGIRITLDQRKERELQQQLLKEKLQESFPLLKERFLYSIVTGKINNETINRRKAFFQWNDLEELYQIIAFILPQEGEKLESIAISEYLKQQLTAPDEVFMNRDNMIIAFLQGSDEAFLGTKVRSVAKKIFRYSEELDWGSIYIGYGEQANDIRRIPDSYNGALTAARYVKLMGFSQIISIKSIQQREELSPAEFLTMENSFSRQLKEGSREQAKKALENVILFIKEHVRTNEEAAYYFIRIHGIIYAFLKEMDLFASLIEFYSLPLPGFDTLAEAERYFIRQIDSIEDKILILRNDLVKGRIEKAKKSIASHYNDKSFSLQDICSELYLSTSQFSYIFKEGTGMTFVEYLTSYRIDQAKKLLKTTDSKSYEIAEAIGYAEPRYFSNIFKKITGLTPMEYRRECEK